MGQLGHGRERISLLCHCANSPESTSNEPCKIVGDVLPALAAMSVTHAGFSDPLSPQSPHHYLHPNNRSPCQGDGGAPAELPDLAQPRPLPILPCLPSSGGLGWSCIVAAVRASPEQALLGHCPDFQRNPLLSTTLHWSTQPPPFPLLRPRQVMGERWYLIGRLN